MKVAVVGGGIGGLAAARALVAAGIDAHVLEASDRAGGVILTSRSDGFVREHAASSFLGGPAHGALALCQELGVAVDKASPAAKRRWIYLDGELRALPKNPIELVTTDMLTWRGKLDLLREPLRAARTGDDDESVHAFATRRLGSEAARAFVAPFVTGVFAADAHEISVQAGFPRLAALDAAGGLVRGMAKQAARGVIAKLKRRAEPRTPRGLYAPHGGLGMLVDALAASLGARVRTGVRVTQIASAGSGVRVDVDGSPERWDGAVLALPADLAAALVVDSIPELASRLDPFYRAPVAIVYLGMDAAAVPRAADGFGFLCAHGEDVRVLGVVFESTVWPDRAPPGQALLRCIFGGGRDPSIVDLADRDLVELAQQDVATVLDARGAPTHASVVRHERGISQYQVGHRDHLRAATATARLHRISLAGADYRGAGINDLVADGDVVAAEVRSW